MNLRFFLALGLTAFAAVPASAGGDGTDPVARTRLFLDAYARGDAAAVLAMIDPDQVALYGSDVAEVVTSREQVAKLLADDQQLWRGSARIGPMRHISVRESATLATVMFDAGFSVGGRPEIPVRFATTWRRLGNRWVLTQSSNTVPTVGSSAAELLAAPTAR